MLRTRPADTAHCISIDGWISKTGKYFCRFIQENRRNGIYFWKSRIVTIDRLIFTNNRIFVSCIDCLFWFDNTQILPILQRFSFRFVGWKVKYGDLFFLFRPSNHLTRLCFRTESHRYFLQGLLRFQGIRFYLRIPKEYFVWPYTPIRDTVSFGEFSVYRNSILMLCLIRANLSYRLDRHLVDHSAQYDYFDVPCRLIVSKIGDSS